MVNTQRRSISELVQIALLVFSDGDHHRADILSGRCSIAGFVGWHNFATCIVRTRLPMSCGDHDTLIEFVYDFVTHYSTDSDRVLFALFGVRC